MTFNVKAAEERAREELHASGFREINAVLDNNKRLAEDLLDAMEEIKLLRETVSDLECLSGLKAALEGCEHKARIEAALAVLEKAKRDPRAWEGIAAGYFIATVKALRGE